MSDAKPESTNSTSHDLENPNSQPSPVAISEENLAALLRATTSAAEPKAERVAEGANAASVIDGNESSVGAHEPHVERPEAVTSPPANVVESRLALFAAVKENRLAISRSGLTPAMPLIDQSPTGKANASTSPAEQYENLSLSLPPKVAPRQVILPETVSLTPAPVTSIATPSPNAINHNKTKNTLRASLVIGLVIGTVIATVGVSTFLTRAHSPETPKAAVPAPIDNVPLQVRVEPLGKGLIDVRWNPQSTSIAQARDGRLLITEPNQKPRVLSLEGEQLKTGHLTYQSSAESIEFDLEIVDRSGAIVKESVLALQSPVASPPLAGTPPQIPREQTATAKPQDIPNHAATAEVPQLNQPHVRTFVPPAAQGKTAQRAIVDAPPTLTNSPFIPPAVGLPVPLPAILPPSTKDGAVQQQVRVESNIEAANLIKKVIPIYPQIARSARIQGTVRFTAHIGKDGRILNLKFTSGPPVLVDSATTAVKQWVYRPMLLDGAPVEVITQIEVNFTLN